MNQHDDAIGLIPCFNEADAIRHLVREVKRYLPGVIVVDDGSGDNTAQIAKLAGAHVLHWPQNHGKGHAVLSGLKEARRLGATWCLTLDGDGQHLPADIPKFFDAATKGAQLVIGNRLHAPEKMPVVRRLTNRIMSWSLAQWLHQPIPDSQCGFRLISVPTWAEIHFPFTASHFEIESEILLAFSLAGEPVAFVPIEVVYNKQGSKIAPFRDTWRWIRWWRKVFKLRGNNKSRGVRPSGGF